MTLPRRKPCNSNPRIINDVAGSDVATAAMDGAPQEVNGDPKPIEASALILQPPSTHPSGHPTLESHVTPEGKGQIKLGCLKLL